MSSSRGLQVVWAIALHFLATPAIAQEDSQPRGVNPKDNITKLDLVYTHDDFRDDVQIDSLAFKYDRALSPNWGFKIEVPLLNFDAPGLSESGIGDASFRARYVETRGRISYLGGGELVLPTASEDVLGAGKWQLNPIVGAVLGLSQTAFVYAGYKHLLSFAGDGDRPDINASQPRLLGAITSAS
jgi:hypothetical protein